MFGCNAVSDTLLQAVALPNKGVSVSCKNVRLVVRLKADSRRNLYSSETMLLQPLDHAVMPPQHSLRSSKTTVRSRACRTSVIYALTYSSSGTLTTIPCLAASRSSRTATGESCGHALIVQQDALMSGRHLCTNVQQEPNAHTVKGEHYASTTLSLPRHQDKPNTGTRQKMPAHRSRRLLAAIFGLNGSARSAATSGKLRLHRVQKTAVVAPAVVKLRQSRQSYQHLKHHIMRCCLSGTMSAMLRMAFTPTAPPLAAVSVCIGCVRNALRDSCTGTKCLPMIGLAETLPGVHIVLARKFANATVWKHITP